MEANEHGGLTERGSLLAGLALVTIASFLLEAALTRVAGVVLGGEVAYALPVLAVLAGGIGALLVLLAPSRIEADRLAGRLAHACVAGAFAAAVAAVMLVHMSQAKAPPEDASAAPHHAALAWTALGLAAAAPFALAGAIGAAILRRLADALPLFCFVYFGSLGVGSFGAILALRAGGPRAFLIVALLFACASLAFGIGGWKAGGTQSRAPGAAPETPEPKTLGGGYASDDEVGPRPGFVATALVGALVLLAGDLGAPWLKLRAPKAEKADFSAWTELGLVTVDRSMGGVAWIREDGRKDSPVYEGKQTPPAEPEDLAFALQAGKGSVLVLDAGGGRGIRAALKAGHREIDAVVLSPTVARDVMMGDLETFSGRIYEDEGVRVTVGDGRSAARSSARGGYRIVLLAPWSPEPVKPSRDPKAAPPGPAEGPAPPFDSVLARPWFGAGSLAEARLFTREAFVDYLKLLEPSGALVVRRPAIELEGVRELAVASLSSLAAETPEAHLFACTHKGAFALVVGREALAAPDVKTLRKHCKANKFAEVLAPDDGETGARRKRRGVGAAKSAALPPSDAANDDDAPLDAAPPGGPPTDDRPFTVRDVKTAGVVDMLGRWRDLASDPAERAAFGAAFMGLAAAAAAFGLSRARRAPATGAGAPAFPAWRSGLGLGALGAAIAWLEIGLVAHTVPLLGHPVHALASVLPVLFVALGFGALAADRAQTNQPFAGLALRGLAACALALALSFGLLPAVAQLVPLGIGVKLSFALLLLGAAGILAGAALPIGLRTLDPVRLPFGWAIFVIGGVLGTTLGTLVAAHVGFSATLFAAAAAFAAAALALSAAEPPRAA